MGSRRSEINTKTMPLLFETEEPILTLDEAERMLEFLRQMKSDPLLEKVRLLTQDSAKPEFS